jgi:hypothetical protein
MEMAGTVQMAESDWVDTRLSSLRQRDHKAEELLLESIRTEGIKQPLMTVTSGPRRFLLLDGFKRYRCARRLRIGMVAILAVEGEEKEGLLTLIRQSREKGLTELEHGAIVDRLHTHHGMSVRQIAEHLGCSTGWVSMRLGMICQMSDLIRRKVLGGQFPPRAYLYGVRPFTRVNGSSACAERFVIAVSGRGLSTRDLFLLTQAYFRDGGAVRARIEQGDVDAVLEAMKSDRAVDGDGGMQQMLDDSATIMACIHRLRACLPHLALHGEIAVLQAHLACAGLLSGLRSFTANLREFYDRTTDAIGGNGAVGAGHSQETDCAPASVEREDGPGDCCQPGAGAGAHIPLPPLAAP